MNASAPDSSTEGPPPSSAEQVIEGTGASPGVAVGTVCRYASGAPDVERTHVAPDEVESELTLLDEALSRAQEDLARVRSVAEGTLGPDGTAILEAQALMLDDDELRRAIRERIRNDHESAAHALTSVLRRHRERLAESDDAYLQDRTSDLHELETRLLRALQRSGAADPVSPDSIVVAERLTAADIIRFAQDGMRGCVTTHGGATSHAAIIARALSVPAVVGAKGATEAAAGRGRALVDGRRGRLILEPSPSTLGRYDDPAIGGFGAASAHKSAVDASVETTDGVSVTLQANVDFDATLARVEEHGAIGIGLLRTELFFLEEGRDALPEEKQTAVYRRAAAATGEHGATIRLLDLGGDKLLSGADREDNPFLGWRGIRVLLDRPDDLLRPQVRALLRANAHGSLRVLLPMVTYLDEVRQVRSIIQEEADRLSANGIEHDPDLPLGVMVEVPAVALQARKFADVADFLSIGTNDLTQFLLALDRGNERVADRFDALHPAVLGLIRRVVEAGRAAGTPVTLCGEVAGDVVAVPVLLGLGVRTLSVAPPSLPGVCRVVRAVAHAATEDLARSVCDAPAPAAVRRQARDWLHEHVGDDVPALQAPTGDA